MCPAPGIRFRLIVFRKFKITVYHPAVIRASSPGDYRDTAERNGVVGVSEGFTC